MKLILIGAGQATAELVTALHQGGYCGSITAIGDEPHRPYQRPPLSKDFLAGRVARESLYLQKADAYQRANVHLMLGTRVVQIDRARKHVQLHDGRVLPYDKLVLNLGGRARTLGIGEVADVGALENGYYVRTIADVERLRSRFSAGAKLVVIGAGYIGLEVAGVAAQSGLSVCVLEVAPRVLGRVTAPEVASFYERLHRQQGVDVRTGVQITGLRTTENGRAITHVCCGDGAELPADLVIAGVGLVPNTELAQAAGLTVDNGIVIDAFGRTSDPDVLAAGDCTSQLSELYGRYVRLESVPNAIEQARTAAATLCGKERPHAAVPWFWSDQFGLKLQIAGLSQGYDELVVRGSMESGSFAAFYLKQGELIAADAVGRPQDFLISKKLLTQRGAIDRAQLADVTAPLKQLVRA